ncbi:MAG: hypothetical protein QW400_00845 [Candidatus Diapherotrites archaeon]
MKSPLAYALLFLLILSFCNAHEQTTADLKITDANTTCNDSGYGKIDMSINAYVKVSLNNVEFVKIADYYPKCLVYINQGPANPMQKVESTDDINCDDGRCNGTIGAKFTFKHAFDSENPIVTARILCYRSGCSSTNTCDLKDENIYKFDMRYCFEKDTTAPKTNISPDINAWYKSPRDFTLQCSDVGVGCSSIYYKKVPVSEAALFNDIWNNRTNTQKLMETIKDSRSGKTTVTESLTMPTLMVYASKDYAGNFESPIVAYVKVDNVAPSTEAVMSKAAVVFKDTFDKNNFDESKWEKTDWTIIQTNYRTGLATANYQRQGKLISKGINLSGAESAILEFYAVKSTRVESDLYLYFCNLSESNCENIRNLGPEIGFMQGGILKFQVPKQYLTNDFRVKFHANITATGVEFQIDDLRVIKNPNISLKCTDGVPYSITNSQIQLASGCAKTEYRIGNSTYWTAGTDFNITDVGCTKIFYRSTDVVGNTESEKSTEFCVEDLSTLPAPVPTPSPSPSPTPTVIPSPSPTVGTLSIRDVSVQTSVSEATITWKTSIESKCEIGVAKTGGVFSWYESITLNQTEHKQSFSELFSNTFYVYEIKCYAAEQSKNHKGTFTTLPSDENKRKINVIGLKVEPEIAYEGEIISFKLSVSPTYPELRYEWDFGDGKKITDNKNERQYSYYLPTDFKDYEKDYNVKVSVIGSQGEKLGYAEKKVVIRRAQIKVKMIKPTLGETLKKTEPAEVRIVFVDENNKIIEPSKITNLYASVDGLSAKSNFDGNELVVQYMPTYKTKNSTILKLSAKISSNSGKIELNSGLHLSFEPIKLGLYHNPFEEKKYPINSEIKEVVVRVIVPQINQPVQMQYIDAYLVHSNLKTKLASVSSQSDPYNYRIMLGCRLSEEHLKQGLALYLQGEDIYGNLFSEKLDIPVLKDNPDFDLELSDYNIGAVKGQIVSVEARIFSKVGLRGNVEFSCENGYSGKAAYHPDEETHVIKLQVPNDLVGNTLECEAKATTVDKNKSWVALENFSIYLVDFTVNIIEPKQGINSSLSPVKSIKIRILKGDGSTPAEEEIYGKLSIDGNDSNLVFKKSGGFYVANLEEPIGFGEHYLKLSLAEPYAYKQEIVAIIKRDKNTTWLLALIVSFSVFTYMGLRIASKRLEKRDLIKNLQTEEENIRSLIKRLKIAYMKKQISKAEFEEKYSEAILRLTKVRSMIKDNGNLKTNKR